MKSNKSKTNIKKCQKVFSFFIVAGPRAPRTQPFPALVQGLATHSGHWERQVGRSPLGSTRALNAEGTLKISILHVIIAFFGS